MATLFLFIHTNYDIPKFLTTFPYQRANAFMEDDLSTFLVGDYQGRTGNTSLDEAFNVQVSIRRINGLSVEISSQLEDRFVSFTAFISLQKEGVLINIADQMVDQFLIKGIGGSIQDKPNVHGGWVKKLNAFYFHIDVDDLKGLNKSYCFVGKPIKNPILPSYSE